MSQQDQDTIAFAHQQIADLSPIDRTFVYHAARKIKEIVKKYGDHGSLALAIIAIELQTQCAILNPSPPDTQIPQDTKTPPPVPPVPPVRNVRNV